MKRVQKQNKTKLLGLRITAIFFHLHTLYGYFGVTRPDLSSCYRYHKFQELKIVLSYPLQKNLINPQLSNSRLVLIIFVRFINSYNCKFLKVVLKSNNEIKNNI